MFNTNSGKLRLSTAAMKIAAWQLADGESGQASRAIRAALCHDNPYPIALDIRDGNMTPSRVELQSRVTWLVGVTGSGKTEAAHAGLRAAARAGHLTAHITAGNDIYRRWHRSEVSAFDFTAAEKHDDLPLPDLVAALSDRNRIHIRLSTPYAHTLKGVDFSIEPFLDAMEQSRAPRTILIEEAEWRHAGLVDRLKSLIMKRPDHRFIIAVQDAQAVESAIDPSRDAVIAMRSCDTPQMMRHLDLVGAPHLKSECHYLREGEGFLIQAGEARPVLCGYEFQLDPDPVLAGSEAERAIRHLKESIQETAPRTHTERLEAVARACGYRSWHAAQGRDR